MIAAIESVKGGQSIKRAAEVHGVPRTTLQDCVKGKVHGANSGPQPYLQPAEEKELSCFLTEVAAVGYGRTKKQVKLLAEMVARDKGVLRSTTKNKGGKVSDGWFRRFMNRQKTITLRKGDPTAQVRMEACSPAIITRYFDQLKSKKRTSQAQKRSNTTKELNAPKRVRLDRVEVSGSDSTLKPMNQRERCRVRFVLVTTQEVILLM